MTSTEYQISSNGEFKISNKNFPGYLKIVVWDFEVETKNSLDGGIFFIGGLDEH